MANLSEELTRGAQAEDLLNHELIQEFLTKIRENIILEIRNSKDDDAEGRERAYRLLKVVDAFERHFVSIIETGRMAQKQLSAGEKVRNLFGGMF